MRDRYVGLASIKNTMMLSDRFFSYVLDFVLMPRVLPPSIKSTRALLHGSGKRTSTELDTKSLDLR